MKGKLRVVLGLAIVIATITAFVLYLKDHPEVITQLRHTSVGTIAAILALFAGILGVLMIVLHSSLRFYQKHFSLQENFLLTTYSSLVNFFGPGQSGPGFRAAYLKVKHGMKIKQYIFITLVYYAFYAFFSGLLLAAAVLPWWQTVGFLLVIALICTLVLARYLNRNANLVNRPAHSLAKPFVIIGLATLLQVLLHWAIYFVELHSLDSSISIGQAATYTGAANFALFVSLTPGAIGFREAFLLFSQNLHHVPNDIIVAANVLDRAVYILFLGILFLIVLALHANKTLQVKKVREAIR